MGDDERHERVAGRADLRAQSRRRLARSARALRPAGAASTAGAAVGSTGSSCRLGRPGSCSSSRSVAGVSRDDSSAVRPASDARGRADATLAGDVRPPPRRLLTAELLSIGSELTVGETRDTNAGELARALTERGVRVGRLTALPDDLDRGRGGDSRRARPGRPRRLDRRPRPDAGRPDPRGDRRRPAARRRRSTRTSRRGCASCGRGAGCRSRSSTSSRPGGSRRRSALANPNGTAPGWFVTRPDGRVIVALPGPPREMRPMWADEVVPRLDALGLGAEVASRTYRLAGIGESQVAELLGEPLLRATNPIVATYARVEAVDVRISAVGRRRRTAADDLVEAAARGRPRAARVVRLGDRRDDLERGHRRRDSASSAGRWRSSRSARAAASTPCSATRRGSASTSRSRPTRRPPRRTGRATPDRGRASRDEPDDDAVPDDLVRFARRARELGGSEVGLAVRARPRTGDTAVSIAISTPDRERAASAGSSS